jgi:hypothetical protein
LPCTQEELELEAAMMFPTAFLQHKATVKPEGSESQALVTVAPLQPGEWKCTRCAHVGTGGRPTCIKCGERKMCDWGLECLRETCWFQVPDKLFSLYQECHHTDC